MDMKTRNKAGTPGGYEYKLAKTDRRTARTPTPIAVFESFSVLAGKDAKNGAYTVSITSNGKKVAERKIADVQHFMETAAILKNTGNGLPYAVAFLKAASHISAKYPKAFEVVCKVAENGDAQLAIGLMNHIAKWRGKTPLVHWVEEKRLELMHIKTTNPNRAMYHLIEYGKKDVPIDFSESQKRELD